jgi:DNA excision repair protein ERCC-3
VDRDIRENIRKFGLLSLVRRDDRLLLVSEDLQLTRELWANSHIKKYLLAKEGDGELLVNEAMRGDIKQALIKIGFPVEDLAGYVEGSRYDFLVRATTKGGAPFNVRRYQQEASDVFYAGGSARGGSGVIVLPCGAGKTIVGIEVMHRLKTHTLILTTNTIAVRQWRSELLDKTEINPDHIGEYTGEVKNIQPITITTYQILTYRKRKTDPFVHFNLFSASNWGLVVYDEVHLLPAPVFRVTAEIQARRRLGLTATLIREDHKEHEVFSLIGPKKYDVPWKVLEKQGWIAAAHCIEVRIPLEGELKYTYLSAGAREKFRIASENPAKTQVVKALLHQHEGDQILIIGQYLDQLRLLAGYLNVPLITGKMPTKERAEFYDKFRMGEIKVLIVSKVGNFAIDLPDANVAIQISGTFGSRQEEAQRLGRILRPKRGGQKAYFYSLVTRDSREEVFANNRQLFLTEQGYTYEIKDVTQVRKTD